MNIIENISTIKNKIHNAEIKSNRPENSVKLMAVSKFHTVEEIKKAIDAGQILFGENRVQEACQKFEELYKYNPNIELHIIGNLQLNKVKKAVKIASCIQSVDRLELIEEIEKQCEKINKNINIFFEIHTAEDSKSGYTSEEDLFESLDLISKGKFPHIKTKGLMTMAPFTNDENLIRKSFVTLKNIQQNAKLKFPNLDLEELSMGMSGDFEIAIEEGSTLVRVGTAIFGERNYNK